MPSGVLCLGESLSYVAPPGLMPFHFCVFCQCHSELFGLADIHPLGQVQWREPGAGESSGSPRGGSLRHGGCQKESSGNSMKGCACACVCVCVTHVHLLAHATLTGSSLPQSQAEREYFQLWHSTSILNYRGCQGLNLGLSVCRQGTPPLSYVHIPCLRHNL